MNTCNLIFIIIFLMFREATLTVSYANAMEGGEHQSNGVVKKNLETNTKTVSQIETELDNKAEFQLAAPTHPSDISKQLPIEPTTENQKPVESHLKVQPTINTPTKSQLLLERSQPLKSEAKEEDETLQNDSLIARKSSSSALSASSTSSHKEETTYLQNTDDVPDSLKYSFSLLLLLSAIAVVFILFKVCKLRTSRAERKYGVQANSNTQELTPLPMAIDDSEVISEDECSLTLYEVHHQHARLV